MSSAFRWARVCMITVAVIGLVPRLQADQSEGQERDRTRDCHIGIYRLQSGGEVDVGATDGDHLRWRRKDGTSGRLTEAGDGTWTNTFGWTDRPDGKRVSFA